MSKACIICGDTGNMTRHHLVPRSEEGYFLRRKAWTAPMGDRRYFIRKTVPMCRPCHTWLHDTFKRRRLTCRLFTKELILAHPWVQRRIATPKELRDANTEDPCDYVAAWHGLRAWCENEQRYLERQPDAHESKRWNEKVMFQMDRIEKEQP
jgi:hypothetical protein